MRYFFCLISIMGVFLLSGCDENGSVIEPIGRIVAPPPPPPASITFRSSMLAGQVLQVTNRSNSETLVMEVVARNDAKNQRATHVFKVRPGDTYEIGMLEMNWKWETGESYEISADGYSTKIRGTVP